MVEVHLRRNERKEEYFLDFPYNAALVAAIKLIPYDEREFIVREKQWKLDAWALYRIMIHCGKDKSAFFKFETDKDKEQFRNIIEKIKTREAKKKKAIADRLAMDETIIEMKANLPELVKDFDVKPFLRDGIVPYNFQKEGAYFISKLNTGILAMDLGTGKTITAILACQMNPNIKKVLCIVPASLKLNWQEEVHKFTGEKAYVVKYEKGRLVNYNRNKGISFDEAKFIILNYDYFNAAKFDFNKRIVDIGLNQCDTIVFDEAHKLGYKGTNTSKNLKFSFDKMIKRRILLTGTPVKNKLSQLFPLLKMVKGEEFSNESKFFVEYCGLRFDLDYKQWVLDENNPPKLEALNGRLNTLMFRVKKEDVLKDLPDMVKHKVFVEMTQDEFKDYEAIRDGIKKYDIESNSLVNLTEEDSILPIVIIARLRQYTASLKVKEVHRLIKELNDDDEKVVIFDSYKKPLFQLKELLGENSALYTGEQSVDERQKLVTKFQIADSGLKNLLISLAAGNAGITLTEAKNLILITESYVPSDNEQCYARIHRIGQKNSVNIFIVVVADTIDEMIYRLVDEKQKMITKVIDNLDYDDSIQQSILNELIKSITGKKGNNDEI